MAGISLMPWCPLCDPAAQEHQDTIVRAGITGGLGRTHTKLGMLDEQFTNPREAGIFWLESTELQSFSAG